LIEPDSWRAYAGIDIGAVHIDSWALHLSYLKEASS